jgi:hypothetical protein
VKAKLAPKISTTGVPGFLLWARRDTPELYAAMVRDLPEVAAFEKQLIVDQGLSGILDVVKSFGSSLASSVGKIGSYVAKNAVPVLTAAVPLIVAKKQVDVAKAQVRLAAAQSAPMQTAMVPAAGGGSVSVPVQYNAATGTYSAVPGFSLPSQSAGGRSVMSGQLLGVPVWGWLAGAGTLAVLMIARRK